MKTDVTERKTGVYVISVAGDVDMSTSPGLRDAILSTFKKAPLHVVVDLCEAPYMDSSGIATLVEGLKFSKKGNARFTLSGLRPSVESVFELAHLKGVFEMVPDLEAALGGEKSA